MNIPVIPSLDHYLSLVLKSLLLSVVSPIHQLSLLWSLSFVSCRVYHRCVKKKWCLSASAAVVVVPVTCVAHAHVSVLFVVRFLKGPEQKIYLDSLLCLENEC